jgi:hypothetical protein
MLYPYITLGDGTEILHSQIIEEEGKEKIEVHFEKAIETGFAVARCILPEYNWIKVEFFSNDEVTFFEKLLESNAHLIYKYAKSGGVKIA